MSDWCVTYDLATCPASWDFLNWLINVEIMRRDARGGPLKVRFAAGPQDGFRSDSGPRPLDQRRAILDRVMRPALRLIGAEEGHDAPNQPSPPYTVRFAVDAARAGKELPRWTVPAAAMAEVASWLGGRRPLVITLRETTYYPERNSDLAAWIEFARGCGEDVVFVRDTAKADEPIEGFETCPRASRDVLFRAALMAQAKANLLVASGPSAIAQYLDVPWLMFKVLVPALPDYKPGRPEWWEGLLGAKVGTQFPWGDARHAIVWGEDSRENIESAWAVSRGLPDPHPIKINGPIGVGGGLPEDERRHRMARNATLLARRVMPAPPHDGTAILCCDGPSLADSWDSIGLERQQIPNARIVTVSGAHDVLIERGLVPDCHVECDPRPHKAAMALKPMPGTQFLLASSLHPGFVETMAGHDAALWHPEDAGGRPDGDAGLCVGGDSAGLRALNLMRALGYRRFVIHGMDCSFRGRQQHAGARPRLVDTTIAVPCAGRTFLTSPARLAHAKTFIRTVATLAEPIALTLRGDGLLLEMCRIVQQKNAA